MRNSRLSKIIREGEGTAGHWKIYEQDGWKYLKHYYTDMLAWNGKGIVIPLSTGYGSVSDQNGMNAAFEELKADYHYSRIGGAHIRDTRKISK